MQLNFLSQISLQFHTDYGYSDRIANGTVLTLLNEKPVVKTQNGAIVLTDFECSETIKEGNIFKTR